MNTQNPTQIEYSKSGNRVYRYRIYRSSGYSFDKYAVVSQRKYYHDVPRIRVSFIGFRLVRNK